MTDDSPPDWDPFSDEVLADQVTAYDEMRQRCPVAHSERLGWSLFRHADVKRVLADPSTFSNVVSQHRSVPNGMDPPEHTVYRRAIEPYFSRERLQRFEPLCHRIAERLLAPLASGTAFDFVEAFAVPFAARCQCAFLGWPESLSDTIRHWTRSNREAVLTGDRSRLAQIASELEVFVAKMLHERRSSGATHPADITGELMLARVEGKPLTEPELASVFRNWTVGEVGSLAAALGILVHHLAKDPDLQARLRGDDDAIAAAIEEILRVSGPLVANRRRVTRDVTLGGRQIAAGDRVTVMWISANRDEAVFDDPGAVRLDRDQGENLLWGAGIHVCPGAPLARLELRIALAHLLRAGTLRAADDSPVPLAYPENGWASLAVSLDPRAERPS